MSHSDPLLGESAGEDLQPGNTSVSEEQLLDEVRKAVLPGFSSRDDVVERVRAVLELAEGDPRPAAVVDRVWAQAAADELATTRPSDYDRLAQAFADLEAEGVVARMNFTCCNTCGTDEIDDERTPIEVAQGYPFRESAYTFFHQQDTDRLADTPTTLLLTYGAWRAAEDLDRGLVEAARAGDEAARAAVVAETDRRIGERVAAALRRRGLTVIWDGSPETRLGVSIGVWGKPLPQVSSEPSNQVWRDALRPVMVGGSRQVQEVLFLTGYDHPIWPDHEEVLRLADQQLRHRVAALPDETSLAFVGVHAKNRITGSRQSLGWLVTDRRVVAQDDYSVIGDVAPPRVTLYTAGVTAESLTDELWRTFDFGEVLSRGDSVAAAMGTAVRAVLDCVVPIVATGELPEAAGPARTLKERVGELGLASAVKWPEEEAKHFAKLVKTFNVAGLRCSLTDTVIFGKVYGLVITADGILSRDLGEDPVRSTWQDLTVRPIAPDETEDGLLGGGVRHIVPPHCTLHREALARLLNELATGAVR